MELDIRVTVCVYNFGCRHYFVSNLELFSVALVLHSQLATGCSKRTRQIQIVFRDNPENKARYDDCFLENTSINVRFAKNKLSKVSTTNAKIH